MTVDEMLNQVKNLSTSDRETIWTRLPELLGKPTSLDLGPALSKLPSDKKAEALTTAIKSLTNEERAQLATQVAGTLGPPSDHTRDYLWLIVVIAFAIVLVGAFLTLAIGVFINASGKVKPELILTMFTSVVGFLAGLFVPSPMTRGKSDGAA